MASRPTTPEQQHDGEQTSERSFKMQRGVSQLLFNYLPNRTVDWEDGLAIVQLGKRAAFERVGRGSKDKSAQGNR